MCSLYDDSRVCQRPPLLKVCLCCTRACCCRWLLLRREAGGIEQRQKHVNVLMYGEHVCVARRAAAAPVKGSSWWSCNVNTGCSLNGRMCVLVQLSAVCQWQILSVLRCALLCRQQAAVPGGCAERHQEVWGSLLLPGKREAPAQGFWCKVMGDAFIDH